MILFGRTGKAPLASSLIQYAIIHLAHFMDPARPGVKHAAIADVLHALRLALPRYLRGRAIAIHHPPLAGTRRVIAGVRVRFVRQVAHRGVTLCAATAKGRLRYVAGYVPEGDSRGRPKARYNGFQVAFVRGQDRKGEKVAPPELLGFVHPKAFLRGRCH